MKNSNFSRLAKLWVAALVLVCGVAFTGCKPEVQYKYRDNYYYILPIEADNALIGTWTSSYGEIFEISTSELKNGGSWGDCYAGNNLCVSEINETSGYIYIKYTRAMNSDYTYSETAPDVGKWYAIYYNNLTATTVDLAGGYKAGGKTSTTTLAEAVTEFTVENGYFASGSTCAKQ